MKIGIPREVKILEGRIALTPKAVGELIKQGQEVFIETQAGHLSGFSDGQYSNVGATIVSTAKELYAQSQLIVKVKEPQPEELTLLRNDHILFSFLHLAAAEELTQALLNIGLTAIAFESVTTNNQLPILAPMSDIAGRIAVQVGAHLLHQPQGGRGILLGGTNGTNKGHVVILGGGAAGRGAAKVASALGAQVSIIKRNIKDQAIFKALGSNITLIRSTTDNIEQSVQMADLLIGAVLIPGAKAPHLVSADMVKGMQAGSVIIDISVDQGGCIETTKPTTYAHPTFIWENIIHFGVTNMPGAVPNTATQALSAALLPYVLELTQQNWKQNSALNEAINVEQGEVKLAALL